MFPPINKLWHFFDLGKDAPMFVLIIDVPASGGHEQAAYVSADAVECVFRNGSRFFAMAVDGGQSCTVGECVIANEVERCGKVQLFQHVAFAEAFCRNGFASFRDVQYGQADGEVIILCGFALVGCHKSHFLVWRGAE